jgi:glutamyl-tRNA reductase
MRFIFVKEREARAALPVVAQMWRRAEQIARAEAERTLSQIGARLDDRGRRSIEATALAIVRRLLHEPTARLASAASSGDRALAGAAAELFGIDAGAPAPRGVEPEGRRRPKRDAPFQPAREGSS